MQRIAESCWSTSTKKRHKNLGEKGWYMYIAKYLRKISTFPLNFKYYKKILRASTLYKDCCRHWVGERTWSPCLAVAQDICRPSLLHHTCITWFMMSHKWWKSMAVWGSLVHKVFLSIYISKYMEHGKLNHLLFHDIQYKWIHISQSLGSQNSDYSNRNFLPTIQYKYPFGEFASFHLLWGEDTKNDDLRRYFHRKSNRWVAVTNILLAEKSQEELQGQEWVKQGY